MVANSVAMTVNSRADLLGPMMVDQSAVQMVYMRAACSEVKSADN
jgi:hypothetical protein